MKTKILVVIGILFGLMMANSGLSKFTHHMPMPELPEAAGNLMGAFAASGWMIPLIAIAEIIGGILFAIPKYRALGAIVILPITIGIALFNLLLSPAQAPIGIVLLLINIWVLWENREKYSLLITR